MKLHSETSQTVWPSDTTPIKENATENTQNNHKWKWKNGQSKQEWMVGITEN